jgi:AcrR family transcriptional regulator
MGVESSAAGRSSAAAATARRQRNARGQGARLSDDIVAAALQLIDRTGTQESVTLRAVAREIGIAAPSIYAHFADRDAIMKAVIDQLFDELMAEVAASISVAADDPAEQLVAGCVAYVRYGREHPARYKVLFSDRRGSPSEDCEPRQFRPGEPLVLPAGTEAFTLLAETIDACAAAGESASTDVLADTTAVWTALHGTVTLRTALPGFPWPEPVGEFVREIVLRLARIQTPG